MRTIDPARSVRSLAAGPLVFAALAALTFAPTVSAAGYPTITLATETSGKTLKLGGLASDDLIVVGFQDRNVSYVRWSKDQGNSFAPKFALHDGLPAKDPRVATCNDSYFAVSSWQIATTPEVGVDYRNFVTGDTGTYSLGPGTMADIACYGEVIAVTWVADGHAWLEAQELGCAEPCAEALKTDLGAGDFSSPPRVTSDYAGFTVTWLTTGLTIQHFDFDTFAPGPRVTLMEGKGVADPVIVARSQRVVVSYQRAGRTYVRISDDLANSFGPAIVVAGSCAECIDGGPRPESIDISGGAILVEVARAYGSPVSYSMTGRLSRDSGGSWESISARHGGSQLGIMIEGLTYSEVWDHHLYNGSPQPSATQIIKFKGGQL